MVDLNSGRLNTLKKHFSGKKIAVVGDMMIDGYFWGDVKRVSPEAPVPVLEVEEEFFRFGGAANVAFNITTLGGTAIPVGVIGNDNYGTIFTSLIKDSKMEASGIFTDDGRPTTTKTRVIANNQHVVRIDKESKTKINGKVEEKISNFISSIINGIDGIILQDYNKGVLTPTLISNIISIANKRNLLITVDPKFDNFFEYKNVTVFKPNKKEAGSVLGVKINSDDDISSVGKTLLERLKAKYILLTLGEKGIAVFENGKPERKMPTKAIKVADVSGAGDTVIATLTMALAAGADIYEASMLANYGAGIVCGEVGIVPVQKDQLFETIEKDLK